MTTIVFNPLGPPFDFSLTQSSATLVNSVTGTTNQILSTPTTGNVVLSLIGPYTPSTYAENSVLVGQGTSSIIGVGPGTSGQIFQSNGASSPPSWVSLFSASSSLIYVDAAAGSDSTGTGNAVNPFKTITYALSTITTNTISNRFAILLIGQTSEAAIVLKPWVSLIGYSDNTSQVTVTGAGTNVTLDPSFLTATNASAVIWNINFVGTTNLLFNFTGGSATKAIIGLSNVTCNNLTLTGRGSTHSDELQMYLCDVAGNMSVTDGTVLSYQNEYDGNVSTVSTNSTSARAWQSQGDLFFGAITISETSGLSLSFSAKASSIQSSVTVTGSQCIFSYDATSIPTAGITLNSGATATASPIVTPAAGGTGINNGTSTLTLAGNLATSGAFASTFTMTGATNVTFPTSGTLATTTNLNSYLPLAGGTMTGQLKTSSNQQFLTTQYSTGTISQSGTSITGSGTTFTSAMNGGWLIPSSGSPERFFYAGSGTIASASLSQTISAGTTFVLYYMANNPEIDTDEAAYTTLFSTPQFMQWGSSNTALVHSGVLGSNKAAVFDSNFNQGSTTSNQTASQSGTTVTGVGTTFTTADVGRMIYFQTGQIAFITAFGSTTSLTVTPSQTVASCLFYIPGQPSAATVMDGLGNMGTKNLYVSQPINFGDLSTLNITGGHTASFAMTGNTSVTFPTSGTLATVSGTVSSVVGTTNQIDVSTTSGVATISIDSGYVGQTSITTLGTIGTGTWQGTLIGLAYGGTNANLTASNGGIFYSTASAGAILAGTATAGQIVLSGSSSAPSWSTTTYPSTNAINTLLYASAANTMSALATANNATLLTNSSGVPAMTALGNSKLVATNSSGTIAARAFSINIQKFSSSGTYTPTTGMLYCEVECVGGGGGGGGSSTSGSTASSAGGGGGAGEFAFGVFSASTIGSSQTVTLGAAGSAGAAGGSTGGTGGTTSLGSLMTAVGGSGGTGSVSFSQGAYGGGSGGTGGTQASQGYNTKGAPGLIGWNSFAASLNISGAGASGPFGAGGNSGATTSAGNVGGGFGSGGAGAVTQASATQQAGGAGTAGYMVIKEYIIN